MQRLFTMFPDGAPGVALVLLRLSVAGGLWPQILVAEQAWSVARLFGLGLVSFCLLSGMATPLAGVVSSSIQLLRMHDAYGAGTVLAPELSTAVIQAIAALSLAMLGPGAFSVDARLFGRRILKGSE